MKNLNPSAGLKQIANGYICLPRKKILELIKNRKIKPLELGYFIILLVSADWDNDEFRYGFIRHESSRLSAIWGIPYATLRDNIVELTKKGVLIADRNTPKITDFHNFTLKGAQSFVSSKTKAVSEEPKNTSSIVSIDSEISEKSQPTDNSPFNASFKSEFNVYPRRIVIRQRVKRDEEYQQLSISAGFTKLTPEDMRWIDENVTEELTIENEEMEKQMVETYFNGDWKEYRKNLKIGYGFFRNK